MNIFKKVSEWVADEGALMDVPEITGLAVTIAEKIADRINKIIYAGRGSLTVDWLPTMELRAFAEDVPSDALDHHIGISYGVVIEIYRDALALARFIDSGPIDPVHKYLFNGPEAAPVLPQGMSVDACRSLMFETTLAWVFFHELAHLLQQHGKIRKDYGVPGGLENIVVDEVGAIDGALQGFTKEIAVSHVTEISADYEAAMLCLGYISLEIGGSKYREAIYMLVCGLTCLFHRFYGSHNRAFDSSPTSSHPDPTVRIRLLVPAIVERSVGGRLDEIFPGGRLELIDYLITALFSAHQYWHMRNIEHYDEDIPSLAYVGDLSNPEVQRYLRIIDDCLEEIRPIIIMKYLGPPPVEVIQFSDNFKRQISDASFGF